jgi:hypothetical protein
MNHLAQREGRLYPGGRIVLASRNPARSRAGKYLHPARPAARAPIVTLLEAGYITSTSLSVKCVRLQ